LASRGTQGLTVEEIHLALERGVDFLNWCGSPNALSQTIAELGAKRKKVKVCVQFEARTASDAASELRQILSTLHTDYVNVLTFYYVEELTEWQEIIAPGGALAYCRDAQRAGQVGMLGLTTHQRPLAAQTASSGLLDMLMIRYNAAHRGAEREVLPVTDRLGMPVVVYTCLRWGALLRGTPDDPPGFVVPSAPDWYRFSLQTPSVTVALMAPETRKELEEDLTLLTAAGPLTAQEYQRLAEHGQRVRKYAGQFP
jgi:predicted aldo/keto reductase-like oxidoreductase